MEKGGVVMSLYNVEVIEELSRVVEQEADSYEDAKELVANRYANEEIVLDWNDLNCTKYEPYPSQEIIEDFDINIEYNSKEHYVVISDKYQSLITRDCKTIEDLNFIVKDFFGDYPELEDVRTEEKNMEV